jgi:6-phosphogluconolactonase
MPPCHVKPEFHLVADAASVAVSAAERILQVATESIAGHGRFRLVLAGGGTPLAAYRLLARASADWSRWWIWFGDERCLPPGDAERNDLAGRNAWLDHVPIPPRQVHEIRAELGAEAAAQAYTHSLEGARPFDLVLLGMGEDGHTASLFPGHADPPGAAVLAVHQAPKPPTDRVSLSSATLSDARRVLFLVTGSGKRDALARWRAGEPLPVARICARERLEVLLDRAAAGPGIGET